MGEQQQFVFLNGVKLPLKGNVQWSRVTPFPSQFMTTAASESDYTPTRKQKWSALQGGMGDEKWDADHNTRYWDADGVDASLSVQTLSPLVTTLGTFGAQPVKLIKFNGKVWAIGHNQISYWSGTAWTSAKTDFANPTDAATFYGDTV